MKKFKERCGAVLLEIIVSIAMLGLLVVPISSGLLLSIRINERSDAILQARLEVSSAVETIMAVGVELYPENDNLEVESEDKGAYHKVTVTHKTYPDISVDTYVRSDSVRGDLSTEGGA